MTWTCGITFGIVSTSAELLNFQFLLKSYIKEKFIVSQTKIKFLSQLSGNNLECYYTYSTMSNRKIKKKELSEYCFI